MADWEHSGCSSGSYCGSGCAGSCGSTYSCSSACHSTCWGYCKYECTSCSGSGCVGNCYGCSGSCSGTCSGSCSGSCTNTCTGSCSGGCSTTCTASCSTACNTTCTGATQSTNLEKLGSINEIILSNDIVNINTAITFEVVNRRGSSVTDVTFAPGDLIDDAKIATLIANLKKAGQTAAYAATEGKPTLKVLIEDLVAKITAANKVQINIS